ncbi:MAG: HlyD family efflux transporter periplasmic adaptor subunit [Anaerolineales bacterium]
MKKKLTILLALFVLTSVLLTACSGTQATPTPTTADTANTVVAEGHVFPKADANLTFNARGVVAEILVKEGQKVSKGDALIRLADQEQAQAALTAAQLELTSAQQAYDTFIRTANLSTAQAWQAWQQAQITRANKQLDWEKIDPNSIQDQIDTAQADVQTTQKTLDDANDTLKKYLDLKSDNPTRRGAEADVRKAEADHNTAIRKVEDLQRQIDTPRAALDAAIAAEAEAKRTYDLSKDGPNPEQKDLLQARLDNAKAQVAAGQDALDSYELKAPFDGVVTDINAKLGELIGPEKYAVQIADFSAWHIETSDLTELEVVKVSVGQKVNIEPDALPGLILNGTVESISQSYKLQGGDVLYTVKIALDTTDPRLRWDMTVQATFNP